MRAPFAILIFAVAALGTSFAQPVVPAQTGALPRVPMPIMMPPIPPSPIQQFRDWLKLPEAEREAALAEYSEEKRVILRRKIQDYAAMPADQRERQLQMLELRWYMRPLMSVAPEQRGNYREMMPPRLHEIIQARLAQWDRVDAETRQEILANDEAREMAIRYFVHIRRAAGGAPGLQPFDPAQRAELQEKLRYWHQTTPAQRDRMAAQLSAFFELPQPERAKALESFADADREEMQKALRAFARLPQEQRRACVESFQKFASMTPAERGDFLRKADRWQQMSTQDRQTWKSLVAKLPPMPPPPMPIPPRPQARIFEGIRMAETSPRATPP